MANIEKRVSKDGKTSYRVKIRLKGFPSQSATFERLTDAKKWTQQTESAIREGRHFKTTEAKRHTLADLIDRYIQDVLPSKKSAKDQTQQLKWWKAEIGSHTLSDVTPSLLAECRDKLGREITVRKKPRSPASVVRYMAALSHAFTIAVKEWGWLEDSPMRKVTKPKESRGRVRFLSDNERTRLLKICKESSSIYLYPVVVLALSTGMRQGEIMSLTWDVVDLNQGRAILHETKNGERRAVAITGHALKVLKELDKVRRIDCNLLFPAKESAPQKPQKPMDLRTPWETAVKKAELQDFHFHDLRHSAASYLAMNGASLAEIAEVLGHKTLQMVKRYAHLSEGHTARVVESMNDKIFGGGDMSKGSAKMEKSVCGKLLDELRADKNRDRSRHEIICIIKEKIAEQSKGMTKAQLVNVFVEAVYGMYHMEAELDFSEDAMEAIHQERQILKLTSGRSSNEVKRRQQQDKDRVANRRDQIDKRAFQDMVKKNDSKYNNKADAIHDLKVLPQFTEYSDTQLRKWLTSDVWTKPIRRGRPAKTK